MHTYDPSNIFAKILRGEIPCKKIIETERTLAFFDAFPKAAIHALVIPKGSYMHLEDFLTHAGDEEILDFWQVVRAVISQLSLNDNGFRLISNSGKHGGQEVPHLHVHLCGGEPLGPMLNALKEK